MALPIGFEPIAFGFGSPHDSERSHTVNPSVGTLRGHLDDVAALARRLVLDVQEGKPIARRDTVALARAVLESQAVRAAEAVLEAGDAELAARAVGLAAAVLGGQTEAPSGAIFRACPKK